MNNCLMVHYATIQAQNIKLSFKEKTNHTVPNLFQIPEIHKETKKAEVNTLTNIDELKYQNIAKWVAPTFIFPKKMEQFVSFLILEN